MRYTSPLTALLCLLLGASAGRAAPLPGEASVRERVRTLYAAMPIAFEDHRNRGDPAFEFSARGSGYGLFLTSTEAVLALARPLTPGESGNPHRPAPAVLRIKAIGANPQLAPVGEDELAGRSHDLRGSDPRTWRSNIRRYAKVRYAEVYPGVDLVFHGSQRYLEYDFIVAPGIDPNLIRLGLAGMDELEVDSEGNVVLHMAGGKVVQRAPVIYQQVGSERRVVDGGYVRVSEAELAFRVGEYDPTLPLVIDPILTYGSYIGGYLVGRGFGDSGRGVAVDAQGNAYVAGLTNSPDFPTVTPLQGQVAGGAAAFVAKIDPSGPTLMYSTYFSGSSDDACLAIAVDADGNAYVAGETQSVDFPTTSAVQEFYSGGADAFVAKIGPGGDALVYPTYLGGSGDDFGRGISVGSDGDAYVIGITRSADFPTAAALQPAHVVACTRSPSRG